MLPISTMPSLLSRCVQPAWPIGLWRWCAWVGKLSIDNGGHMGKGCLYGGQAGKLRLGRGDIRLPLICATIDR